MTTKYALRLVLSKTTSTEVVYAFNEGEQFIHERGAQCALEYAMTFDSYSNAQRWIDNPTNLLFEIKDKLEIVTVTTETRLHVPAISDHNANLAIIALCRQGQRVTAIKMYRELHNTGLKTAKDYVDSLCPYVAAETAFVYQYLSKGISESWLTVDYNDYQRAQREGFQTRILTVCD